MIAETVFVGTELLLGEILNTNAQYISRQLSELGIDQYHQIIVGDNPGRLRAALSQALSRADVVITSGGLGPTLDDITREVAAVVTRRPLALDAAAAAAVENWFRQSGRPMPGSNNRQAMVPAGATVLPNPLGTAPGLLVPATAESPVGGDGRQRVLILLPGPPHEMTRMFTDHVIPYLTQRRGPSLGLFSRTFRLCGIGESALADRLQDVLRNQTDPTVASYPKLGEVHLRLATKALSPEAAAAKFTGVETLIRQRVGRFIYGLDEITLEAAIGDLLRHDRATLAIAESCTGGLVAERLTACPGASDYFVAGYVTYANAAKEDILGVPGSTLAAHGAVSEATAAAMAQGAARRAAADYAVATTGIAGPGGGTPEKPVGTVWIGLHTPAGTTARQYRLRGDRALIRAIAAQYALTNLWHHLANRETGTGS